MNNMLEIEKDSLVALKETQVHHETAYAIESPIIEILSHSNQTAMLT